MTKTPSVAYYTTKIKTFSKTELYEQLEDSTLTPRDYAFLSDIIEGLSNQQLATKYHKSPSRISHWKRSIFEQMHKYDLHQDQIRRNDTEPR